ncbi:MAG TPA: L,D-transpeptidase family protein [Patescibacteria group bacterium]
MSKKEKPKSQPIQKHALFKGKYKGLFLAVLLLVIGNLLLWGNFSLQRIRAGKFPVGTSLHGQSLSGLTKAQAEAKLSPVYESILTHPVTLHIDSHTFQTTPQELGLTIDTTTTVSQAFSQLNQRSLLQQVTSIIPFKSHPLTNLAYTINEETLTAYFNQINKELPHESVDLSFDYQNGSLVITPPITALTFDITQGVDTIKQINPLALPDNITLPVTTQLPVITTEVQAQAAQTLLNKVLAQPLKIEIDEIKTELSPQDIFNTAIFAQEDNKLVVTFDETALKDLVSKIAKQVDRTPITRKVFTHDNSVLAEGRDGRKLNVTQLTKVIAEKLTTGETDTPIVMAADTINRSVIQESPEYELGRTEGKYIDVDLSLQKLNIIEGSTHIRSFSVSTGSWSTPTPIGQFTILNHQQTAWSKKFKLYMPFWMAIKAEAGAYDGYGIHGLPYWPSGKVEGTSHIGRPVSHGCIRLGPGDAETVYAWADNGTKVFIHQ